MIFILGIIVGILLTLSTVAVSIHLDNKGKSVLMYMKDKLPQEKGFIINNDDEKTNRLIKTFTKSDKI